MEDGARWSRRNEESEVRWAWARVYMAKFASEAAGKANGTEEEVEVRFRGVLDPRGHPVPDRGSGLLLTE